MVETGGLARVCLVPRSLQEDVDEKVRDLEIGSMMTERMKVVV